MRHWNYTIIGVLVTQQAAATAAAVNMGGNINSGTFVEGYAPTSAGPATYYVACLALSDAHRAQVEAMKPSFPGCIVIDYDPLGLNPQSPPALLAAQGLVRVAT